MERLSHEFRIDEHLYIGFTALVRLTIRPICLGYLLRYSTAYRSEEICEETEYFQEAQKADYSSRAASEREQQNRKGKCDEKSRNCHPYEIHSETANSGIVKPSI